MALVDDLVDDLAEFGVMFDWITPLWTAIQNRRNGPACGCTVSADGDWSAFALRDTWPSVGSRRGAGASARA